MASLDLTARITADASSFEGEIKKVGASAERMSKDVAVSAKRAGDAVDGIGAGAEQSAQQFTRAGARIRDEIQKSTKQIEDFGKTASEKLQLKIVAKGLDPAQFQPYLAKLREVENAQAGVGTSLGGLRSALAGLGGLLAGIGAGVSIAGFTAVTKAAINALDAFNDLKDATGASIENISALEDIASRTGANFDVVSTSLIKLNQALNTAKPGSDAEKAIKAIGLSVKDLKDLDPAEAFQKVAVALNGFADDSNKARLTQELFGKSLKEVAPLLKDVADAGSLVAAATTEQAEAAETFNKQLFALKTDSSDAARAISVELLPVLIEIADVFKRSKDEAGGLASIFGGALKTTLQASTILFANVSFVLKGVGREIGAIAAQTVALATLDIKGFHAISDAVKADGVQARKELDVLERRILGVGSLTVISNNQSEAESRRLGLSGGPSKKSVGDIGGIDKAAAAAASAYNAELKKQADLLNTLTGVNADYQESLTRLQAIKASGRISDEKYVELVKQLIEKQPMVVEQRKQEEEALKAASKAQDAYVKEQLKGIEAAEKSAKSAGDTLQKYLDEEQALTLAAAKNISLAQAIAEVELARLREAQTAAIASKANQGVLLALDEEIKKREQIVQAIGRKESREAVDKSAKEAAADWKKAAEQIEQSITDALLRGFESGKGFGENLRDTLQNMFKTLVLRPVISAVVNPIAGQIASATGNGQGNFGGSNSPNFLSDFGGASAASYDKAGQWLINNSGTNQALGDFGSSLVSNSKQLGEYTKVIGDSMSYLEAASNFKDGSYGASIGQAAGTYFFGPIGGQIGKSIGEAVDKLFSPGEYVQSLGESVATITADKIVSLGGSGGNNDVSIGGGLNIRQTEESDSFVKNIAAAFLSASTQLGIKSAATFGFGNNNSDGGKFAVEATVGGKKYDPGQVKTSDAALQLEASRAVFFALQSSELPGYLSKVFNGITASTAAQADIDAALNYAAGLKTIRDALTETRTPLQVLQDSVSSAFTALGTSADTFKTDFVSAIDAGISPDKLAQFQLLGANLEALAQASGTAASSIAEVTKGLQATSKALEADLKKAQIDNLTALGDVAGAYALATDGLDANQRAIFDYNASLGLQVQGLQAATQAIKDSASESARVAGIVAGDYKQLLNAQGLPVDERGSRNGQPTSVGASTRVNIPGTVELLNASLDAFAGRAFAGLNASGVSDYAQSLGITAQSLQATVDQLNTIQAAPYTGPMGDDNARYAAMAASGYSGVSQSMQDATKAADDFANALKGLVDTNTDLQAELLAAQGDIAGAATATRDKEIAKLLNGYTGDGAEGIAKQYDANEALRQQIKDVTAAADAAAKALSAFQGAMKGLTDTETDLRAQLLDLQGDKSGSAALLRSKALASLTAGTTADNAAKITAQYDSNEALREQIKALTDTTSAAQALKNAWEGITDGLLQEVDRIRGAMSASSLDSMAAQQARFGIATAQARAGDQDAAKALASYSSQLLSSAADNVGSRAELLTIQAQVADSLQTTAGILGAGPSVLSAIPQQQQPTNQKLEALVQTLTDKIANLEGRLSDIQTNTRRTADVIDGGVVVTEAA